MKTESTSLWLNPYRQALASFAVMLLINLIFLIVKWLSSGAWIPERIAWILAASFLLLFGIFNALVLLSTGNMGKYWSQSIISYAGFAIGGGLIAALFSGIPLSEAGSFSWIYMVISFSYLIFLSIGGLMKIIVELAQRADTRNFENRRHKNPNK
jgi:hypothetical protein